jgi:hypothetical protein
MTCCESILGDEGGDDQTNDRMKADEEIQLDVEILSSPDVDSSVLGPSTYTIAYFK